MKEWLVETIDQIALGEALANSSISCGQRFGLIAVDNAVEFMLIAFVELDRQLVGGHKPGGITKQVWRDTKEKFPALLLYVAGLEANLQQYQHNVISFHDLRNGLYHSGMPVTIPARLVKEYSKLARNVLAALFSITFSPFEWEEVLANITWSGDQQSHNGGPRRQVEFAQLDGLVTFTTLGAPTHQEAIALCLFGFGVKTGSSPTGQILFESMKRSGQTIDRNTLNARLHELRKKGWVRRMGLSLTEKGHKELAKKYLFT